MIISDKTPTENLSLEDFLALPETTPASEYINGKIYLSKTNAKRKT